MARMLDIMTKLGGGTFLVQRFSGREELGRMFEYQLELLSERADITAEQLLGSDATVSLELDDGTSQRYFNGYVTRFAVQGSVRTTAYKSNVGYLYLMTLNPGLWFQTRSSNSQIFAGTSIGDVIKKQLAVNTLNTVDPQIGTTETRDYIVQYRETDFNFISRLAEHAGIYYYFTHDNGTHTMVLVDEAGKHKPNPIKAQVSFSGEDRGDATLHSLRMLSEVQSGSFATGDYNYVTPNTQIAAVDNNPKSHDNAGFEIFDFPIDAVTTAQATTYAKTRYEELTCRYAVVHGSGTERGIQVGFKTTVAEHSAAALNQEYLVISHSFVATNNLAQSSSGGGASFECQFEAIPAGTQFRPARVVPRPTIAGTQTALVVDDFGGDVTDTSNNVKVGAKIARVKVEFYWDRYGKQSCWARVSSAWAGKGYGWQNMPRKGEEVLVAFMEGDPDRPVVVGRVYNAENMPPFELPAHKSITGMKTLSLASDGSSVAGKWNELRFDDQDGSEQIYIQAQKDYDRRVLNDSKTWIGNESHNYVKADTFDKYDADHHTQTTGDRNEKIGGTWSMNVTGDHQVKIGKNLGADVGTEVYIKAGQTVVIEAGMKLTLKCGGNTIAMSPSGIEIAGAPLVKVNSGASGAATGSPVSPTAPKDAKLAMTSEGGTPLTAPTPPTAPTAFSPTASSFKLAAVTAAPFVSAASCSG
ncbi:MAG: type VI secretion system Vgr family protein [Burkholderiaceae bacterium]